jgi:hypothetical protein
MNTFGMRVKSCKFCCFSVFDLSLVIMVLALLNFDVKTRVVLDVKLGGVIWMDF